MTAKRSIISVALVTLFFTHAARAQTPPQGKGPQAPDAASKAEARRALESQAVELLSETVNAGRGLKLAENRARVLATAAGLLWPRDEKAARALFKEATDIVVALAAGGPEERQQRDLPQLRQEMLEIAVSRDAKAALDFLRATRQPSPERTPGGGPKGHDPELALEMNLASRIAAQDPKQAFSMAEESLRKGVSSTHFGVLHMLGQKDPEAATRLAGLIIKKLTADDLLNDYEAMNVATQLLNVTRPPAPPAEGAANPEVITHWTRRGGVAVDERTRRQLIEMVVAAALSDRPSRTGYNFFHALPQLMPEVEKYAPSRVAALRARMSEFERRNLDPQSRVMKEYQSVLEQGTFESIAEAASKAPAEVRDQLYMQAFWRAVGEGQGERARQLAESISNPPQRAQLLRELERQLPWRAIGRGDYEEARAMVAQLPAEERIPLLLQIGGALLAKGDKQGARQLLEEAFGMVGARAQNHQQFTSQLDIAIHFAPLDGARAFEIVESAVGQLNELLGAAALLDGFSQDAFKEGELRQQGGYIWNDLIGRCAAGLAHLAPGDFSRARSIAERFERPDARVIAQLTLAREVLNAAAAEDNQNLPQTLPTGRRMRSNVRSVRVMQ